MTLVPSDVTFPSDAGDEEPPPPAAEEQIVVSHGILIRNWEIWFVNQTVSFSFS